MAKRNVCPGCSRHCRMDNVRCKYGQKYFAKMQKDCEKEHGGDAREKKKLRKWERHVQRGGLIWQFLWVASLSKRVLRKKKFDERQLLVLLNEEERLELHRLLKKLVTGFMDSGGIGLE